jgi:hypothetical protein
LSEPPISTVSLDSVIFFEKAAFSPQFKQTAVSLIISSQSGIKFAISPNGLKKLLKKKIQTFSGMFHPTQRQQQFCLCLLILHRNLKCLGTKFVKKFFKQIVLHQFQQFQNHPPSQVLLQVCHMEKQA